MQNYSSKVLGEERKGKKLKRCHAGNIEHYQISINSYRLQGIKKLAQRFVPIPFAPDGLTEEFYDLDAYNPAESKFIMKLQVHPERMSQEDSHGFDLLIRKLSRSQGMTGKMKNKGKRFWLKGTNKTSFAESLMGRHLNG
ncbi:hypothetical protein H5410_025615 [Solanum commersonii]|uniref:Uncharacterized protein n=1 Tax=Solanum commersonii TaxID=4109 RepID=A0A9J5YTM5_SOLCO|nr:hypothetical protein H5410_025615 [Solanum commersonii]